MGGKRARELSVYVGNVCCVGGKPPQLPLYTTVALKLFYTPLSRGACCTLTCVCLTFVLQVFTTSQKFVYLLCSVHPTEECQ